jgi:hypothetical protein
LVAAYWMLKRDEPYHDLGADWHRRRSDEAHTRRLVACAVVGYSRVCVRHAISNRLGYVKRGSVGDGSSSRRHLRAELKALSMRGQG